MKMKLIASLLFLRSPVKRFIKRQSQKSNEPNYSAHNRLVVAYFSEHPQYDEHAIFGVAGMNNDVNILRQSSLFNDLKVGKALDVPFVANNVTYKRGNYLTDSNNKPNLKSIGNPFQKDLEKVATSFFVINIHASLDAKGLWNACVSYGRLVDGSSLINYLKEAPMNDEIHKPNPNPKPIHTFTSTNHMEPKPVKPSFASVIHNKPKLTCDHSLSNHVRIVVLNDRDLIRVNDSSTVILFNLKDVDSMSNMYVICRNKGFSNVKIHHAGGLWIWIQFSTPLSCFKFQENNDMKSFYSLIKSASPSLKVDERMICVEINRLPFCAWGSNAFKKVACMFRKFMFFDNEESTAMISSRVCISTKSYNFVSERVKVEVNRVMFDVHVHELGSWSINVIDGSLDTSSNSYVNDIDKFADSVE
nr:RNA-directed DNA polymerase, eukaryota [Tanacetum cinerariifolium]